MMKLDKKPSGTAWRQELLNRIAAELDAGKTITIEVNTPTMTPQQVADELGLSRTTVLRKIGSGVLKASKQGNRNRVAVADFERFRDSYIRDLGQAFAQDF